MTIFCKNRINVMNDIFSEIVIRKTMAQYITQIRTLAKSFQLQDPSDKTIDKVIEKYNSKKLRKRLLKEHE